MHRLGRISWILFLHLSLRSPSEYSITPRETPKLPRRIQDRLCPTPYVTERPCCSGQPSTTHDYHFSALVVFQIFGNSSARACCGGPIWFVVQVSGPLHPSALVLGATFAYTCRWLSKFGSLFGSLLKYGT